MAKKLIVFDLDGTLAASKQPITAEMAELLSKLLERFKVCVISGGELGRFWVQLLDRFKVESTNYQNISLMPTNGTSFYRFDHGQWKEVYKEELALEERQRIAAVLVEAAEKAGIREIQTWGDVVEDRGSQVTYSALGQNAPIEAKTGWDTDHAKRKTMVEYAQAQLPGFEVTIAGETSVDVTRAGIDKAYGIKKLEQTLGVMPEEILFVGDALDETGNDHPVKAMGIETIEVRNEQDTALAIKHLLDTQSGD